MVSRVAWLYTALVVGSAAALTAVTPLHSYHQHFWVNLIILQLLFLICDCPPAPLAARQSAWSPSSAATLAGVVLLGPVGAALVGAVSVLSLRRQLRLAEPAVQRRHVRAGRVPGRPGLRRHGPARTGFGPPQVKRLPRPSLVPFAAAARGARAGQPAADVGGAAGQPGPQPGRRPAAGHGVQPAAAAGLRPGLRRARAGRRRAVRRDVWWRSPRCSSWCRCSWPGGRWASSPSSSGPTRPPWPRCARRWRPRTSTPAATASGSRAGPA